MAEEVKMEPVAGAEPPKAVNPLGPKPTISGLKPGLKLPPKPGATVTALKPGLKLPPKPGATVTALKPGLKLPPKPGATVTALKPGLKLPARPVIHKPGATVAGAAIPKPVTLPKPVEPVKPAEAPVAEVKPAEVAPVEAPKPVEPPVAELKPVEDMKPVEDAKPVEAPKPVEPPVAEMKPVEEAPAAPAPMEALKAATQTLKSVTQPIPQQAILRKTGIIADSAMTEEQKEAAKHKTARISLSDAMGVAPVKNENAPMKTIRIKRPIDIPNATRTTLKPLPPPNTATAAAPAPVAEPSAPAAEAPADAAASTEASTTITQRKTLKISRPGAVRPAGKFGIKHPSQATTIAKTPAAAADGEVPPLEGAEAPVSDIADIPEMPPSTPFAPASAPAPASDGPAWLFALSSIVQAAACVAMGVLAWYLYQNCQTMYF